MMAFHSVNSVYVFLVLGVVSLAIAVWQYVAAWRFPLHRRCGPSSQSPGISVLKPLKGSDLHTRSSLESWFTQQYPGRLQLLFGVRDPEDPVGAVVRELMEVYPHVSARLVVCAELLGANAKVSTLVHLEPWAQEDILVISDADVRVPKDFLVQLMGTQLATGVAMTNAFYRLANPANLAMQWEAVSTNVDFWSQVLQSRTLKPQDFALGATIAFRRRSLQQIGGFRSLVDHLADDYHLGNRLARMGERIEICPVVVDCWEPESCWAGVWTHQLRWARTIRVCQPWPYFASILSNLTVWACVLALNLIWAPGPAVGRLRTIGSALVGLSLAWRAFAANSLRRRMDQVAPPLHLFWMPWFKDLMAFWIWLAAFLGNTVVWRGIRYRVGTDGKLAVVESSLGGI